MADSEGIEPPPVLPGIVFETIVTKPTSTYYPYEVLFCIHYKQEPPYKDL